MKRKKKEKKIYKKKIKFINPTTHRKKTITYGEKIKSNSLSFLYIYLSFCLFSKSIDKYTKSKLDLVYLPYYFVVFIYSFKEKKKNPLLYFVLF